MRYPTADAFRRVETVLMYSGRSLIAVDHPMSPDRRLPVGVRAADVFRRAIGQVDTTRCDVHRFPDGSSNADHAPSVQLFERSRLRLDHAPLVL